MQARGTANPPLQMERCVFGKQEITLPESLVADLSVFMEVFSVNTWKNVLTDGNRRHLVKFLPSFPENDVPEKQNTLRQLFGGQVFKFTNPLTHLHKKMRDGRCNPEIVAYVKLCRQAKQREYRYQQQVYYTNLLKEILINRQRILERVCCSAPEEPIHFHHYQYRQPRPKHRHVDYRVDAKYRQTVLEVNHECGFNDTSSESDTEAATMATTRKQVYRMLHPAPEDDTRLPVQWTLEPRPQLTNGDSEGRANKRPASPHEVTEVDYTEMIRKHKRRKQLDMDHPELDTSDITLEDVLTRAQFAPRSTKPAPKKKAKEKGEKKMAKVKVKEEKEEEVSPATARKTGTPVQRMTEPPPPSSPHVKEEVEDEPEDDLADIPEMDWSTSTVPVQPENYGEFDNFFSVLRDFICEEVEDRITTLKLEERVREWQEAVSSANNIWFADQPLWTDQVAAALKFLSGDVLGLSLDNFVPFLDYKERAQQWKWIAHGRDTDGILGLLYAHWLAHRDPSVLDPHLDGSASPPPPRWRTTYSVQPTTEEQKVIFRTQERMRFESPHRAFTYRMHGFESVVGPVKGVYTKDNGVTKAREHTLLVNERPAFVTILTLVRDAAARLPNGEGTRNDICEILKDSLFVAPGVTDQQINTVVSGALDRLHYEKDPCVKYDVNRKMWIYLHRSRTQDEFERIHQAQGAAAKAKKAFAKTKPTKKIKESTVSQAIPTNPVAAIPVSMSTGTSIPSGPHITVATPTPTLSRQSSILSTGSNDSFVNVETLSPSPVSAAAAAHSPKQVAPSPAKVSMAASPRGSVSTPQASPRPTPQSSPKLGVFTTGRVTGTPTLSSTVAGVSALPRMGAPTSASKVAGPHKSITVSLVPPTGATKMAAPVAMATPVSAGQTLMASGGQPLTFSLIHTQDGTKLVENLLPAQAMHAGGQIQHKTMLLRTADGKGQRILTTPISQPQTPTSLPTQTVTLATGGVPTTSQTIQLQLPPSATVTTIVTPVATSIATSRSGMTTMMSGGKPVLTRMVQQMGVPGHSQVLNIGNLGSLLAAQGSGTLLTSSQGLITATRPTTPATRIQGGSMLQSALTRTASGSNLVGSVSAGLKRAAQEGSLPGTPTEAPSPMGGRIPSQVAAAMEGKPVGSKPTMAKPAILAAPSSTYTVSSTKPQTVSAALAASRLPGTQSAGKFGASAVPPGNIAKTVTMATGGKPVAMARGVSGQPMTIGGKPIILSGNPAVLGGKPIHLGGKPLQLIQGKPGQFSILQSVQGQPTLVSAVNITSQVGSPVTASQVLQAISTTAHQVRIGAPGVVTSHTQGALRLGTGQGLPRVSSHVQGHPPGIIMATGAAPGVRAGGKGQTMMAAGQQGALIPGTQIIVQSPAHAGKVGGAPQHMQGGMRPTLLQAPGSKAGPNIQLLKTVISQPGGKPGQATLLLTQPPGHSTTTTGLDALRIPTGPLGTSVTSSMKMVGHTAPGISKGGKTQPIYARIITPPPGIRLTAVRGGQVLGSPVPGVGMIQTMTRLPPHTDPTTTRITTETGTTHILTPTTITGIQQSEGSSSESEQK